MPNWCLNMIEIKGDKEHLENLKNKIAEGQNGPTNFMEYLIGLGDIPDDYQRGWYDYNCERFGTKWDISFSDLELKLDEESVLIAAESAWDPIIPFLSTLCKMYNVTASVFYEEPGEDFGGKAKINKKGKICDNRYSHKEAFYLYYKRFFWELVKSDFKGQFYDDYGEMIQSLHFVSAKDKAKIDVMWNANKYNL